MPQDKSFDQLRMDATRLPRDATAVSSTSTQAIKNGNVLADDGASYSTVQAAQDAASSWIKLPPNTFNESVTINTDGLTLVGSGYGTIIDGGTTGTALEVTASDVTVVDVSARTTAGQGNQYHGIAVSGPNFRADTVRVRDSDGEGIKIQAGAPDAVLTSCYVEACDQRGIEYDDIRGVIVACVVSSGVGGDGIQDLSSADDSIISASEVTGVGDDGISWGGNDTQILACRVHSAGNNGINVSGTDQTIVNNRVSDSAGSNVRTASATTPLTDSNETGPIN